MNSNNANPVSGSSSPTEVGQSPNQDRHLLLFGNHDNPVMMNAAPHKREEPVGVSVVEEQISTVTAIESKFHSPSPTGQKKGLQPGWTSSSSSEVSSDLSIVSTRGQLTKRRNRKTWRQSIQEQDDELELLSAGDVVLKCKSLQCKVRELEADLMEVNTGNTRLQNAQVTYQQTQGQFEKTVSGLRTELEEYKSKAETKEQQNKALREVCETTDIELLKAKNELITAQTETGKAVRELDIVRKSVMDHSDCMTTEERLMGTIKALKRELNLMRDDATGINKKLDEKEARVENLKKELQALQQENTMKIDDAVKLEEAMRELSMHSLQMDRLMAKTSEMISFSSGSASQEYSTDDSSEQDGDFRKSSKSFSTRIEEVSNKLQQGIDYSRHLHNFAKASVFKLGMALNKDCSLDSVNGPKQDFGLALVEEACELIHAERGVSDEAEFEKISKALDVWISAINSITKEVSERCKLTPMSDIISEQKPTFAEKMDTFSNKMVGLPEYIESGFKEIEANGEQLAKDAGTEVCIEHMNTWIEKMTEAIELCQNEKHESMNRDSTSINPALSTAEKVSKVTELSNELCGSVKHSIAKHQNEVDLIFLNINKHVSELERDLGIVDYKQMKSVESVSTKLDRFSQVLDGLNIFRVAIEYLQQDKITLQSEQEVHSTIIEELQSKLHRQSQVENETIGNGEGITSDFGIVCDKLQLEFKAIHRLFLEKEALLMKLKDLQINQILSCSNETVMAEAVTEMQPMIEHIQPIAENIHDKVIMCMNLIKELQRLHRDQSTSKPCAEKKVMVQYETQLRTAREVTTDTADALQVELNKIRNKLATLENEKTELTTRYESDLQIANEKNQELVAEVSELTTKTMQCQLNVNEEKLRKRELVEEESKQRDLIGNLKRKIDALKDELHQDGDQINAMKEIHAKEVHSLKQQVQQLVETNNDQSMKEDLKLAEDKKNQVLEKLSKLKEEQRQQQSDDCRRHEVEVIQLQTEINAMKVEATKRETQVRSEAEKQYTQQISDLEGQLATQMTCNEELSVKMNQQILELDRLEAELQQKDDDKEMTDMQQKVDNNPQEDLEEKYQSIITKLEAENVRKCQEISDMEMVIKSFQGEKDALSDGFNCEQRNLIASKQELAQELVQLKEFVKTFEDQQNIKTKEITRLQQTASRDSKLQELNVEFEELKVEKASLATKTTSLEMEKLQLEDKLAKYESQNVVFTEKCNILQSEVEQLKASIGEKDCEVTELRRLVCKKDCEVTEYAEQSKQHALTIVTIEERLNQVVQKNKQYRNDIEKQQQEISHYHSKIQDSERDNEKLGVEVVTLVTPPITQATSKTKHTIHNPSAASQQILVRVQRENANLKNQNDQAQKVIAGLKRDITGLAARLGDVAGEIDEAKKREIDENRIKISNNDRELSDHKVKVKDLFKIIDEKLADTRRLKSELKKHKEGCIKLKKFISDRDKQIAELQEKLETYKASKDKDRAEKEEQGKLTQELVALGSTCRGERHTEVIANQRMALTELRAHLREFEQWPRPAPNHQEALQQVMMLKRELAVIRTRDSLSETVPSMVPLYDPTTRSAQLVSTETFDLSENSYIALLNAVASALDVQAQDALHSLIHIPPEEQYKLLRKREKMCGTLTKCINQLLERINRKEELLAGYEQDLAKLHQLQEISRLQGQQVNHLTDEIRERTEESQCLRATLEKVRSQGEPNRRYVLAINDKNHKDQKLPVLSSHISNEVPTDSLTIKMPKNKTKETSELIKKKNYEISVLKTDLAQKERQLNSMKKQILNLNESQQRPSPPAGRPSSAKARRARPTSAKRPMSAKVQTATRSLSPPIAATAKDARALIDDAYEIISSTAEIRKSLEIQNDGHVTNGSMPPTVVNEEEVLEGRSSLHVSFSNLIEDAHTYNTEEPIMAKQAFVDGDVAIPLGSSEEPVGNGIGDSSELY